MRAAVNSFLDGTCEERNLLQALLLPSIFLFACTGQKRGCTCFNTRVVAFLHKLQTFNEKQEVFPFLTMIVMQIMSHINTPGLRLSHAGLHGYLVSLLKTELRWCVA